MANPNDEAVVPAKDEGPPPWEMMLGNAPPPDERGPAPTIKKETMPWEMMLGNPLPQMSNEDLKQFNSYQSGPIDFDSVFDNLIQAESRGRHFTNKGTLTTSNVGARGITQVMPKTGKDPGYGVKPLQNDSEEEYIRFGRDYLQAMLNEFDGDYAKAVAAYNAGAGSVKKAIMKGGDNWTQYLPKKSETIPYLEQILGVKFG